MIKKSLTEKERNALLAVKSLWESLADEQVPHGEMLDTLVKSITDVSIQRLLIGHYLNINAFMALGIFDIFLDAITMTTKMIFESAIKEISILSGEKNEDSEDNNQA